MIDETEIDRLRNALKFYADSDNYWSSPIPLELPICRTTLRIVRDADKTNKVLKDRGNVARVALGLEPVVWG